MGQDANRPMEDLFQHKFIIWSPQKKNLLYDKKISPQVPLPLTLAISRCMLFN